MSSQFHMSGQVRTRQLPVSIASGATVTSSTNLAGDALVGIVFPAAFTSVLCKFQCSTDDINWFDLYNASGDKLEVTSGTSRCIALNRDDLVVGTYIRMVTEEAETPSRSITFITRSVL